MFLKKFAALVAVIIKISVSAQTLSPSVLSGIASQSRVGNFSLSATCGQPFSTKLVSGKNMLTQGFEQPEIQIITDTLPAIMLCSKATFQVPYTAWGYVDAANVFTAQLSDSSGSFANPRAIGNTTGTSSGSITASIPPNITVSANYRIRVVGGAPYFNGIASAGNISDGNCLSHNTTSTTTSLSALAINGRVTLTAANRNDSQQYVIERGTSNRDFELLGAMDKKDDLTGNTATTFTDENPPAGLVFYRLVQQSENGTTLYSEPVSVNVGEPDMFSCYPNPSSGVVYFNCPKNEMGKILVYDARSRMVLAIAGNANSIQRIDITNFPAGVYLATYQSAESSFSARVVKQ